MCNNHHSVHLPDFLTRNCGRTLQLFFSYFAKTSTQFVLFNQYQHFLKQKLVTPSQISLLPLLQNCPEFKFAPCAVIGTSVGRLETEVEATSDAFSSSLFHLQTLLRPTSVVTFGISPLFYLFIDLAVLRFSL